jgi:hypothetical protein
MQDKHKRDAIFRLFSSGFPHRSEKMTREVRHDYPLTFAAYAGDSHLATPKNMLSDVCLLAFWAAMVPVSMWIGSAAGF